MANFASVILVGRVIGDAESRDVGNGGKVAKCTVAVNYPKKNQDGSWDNSDSAFCEAKAWNNGNYKLADTMVSVCKKGTEVLVSGQLKMDSWEDKNGGGKRTKLYVLVDKLQIFAKQEGQQKPSGNSSGQASQPSASNGNEDIPF